mmetsp:Transcript_108656/g.346891  ORF Transcript_108656/g.346891 Transcript_108656/m.346891 type:complete len:230 (-) Transcript_108656:9-698(-)
MLFSGQFLDAPAQLRGLVVAAPTSTLGWRRTTSQRSASTTGTGADAAAAGRPSLGSGRGGGGRRGGRGRNRVRHPGLEANLQTLQGVRQRALLQGQRFVLQAVPLAEQGQVPLGGGDQGPRIRGRAREGQGPREVQHLPADLGDALPDVLLPGGPGIAGGLKLGAELRRLGGTEAPRGAELAPAIAVQGPRGHAQLAPSLAPPRDRPDTAELIPRSAHLERTSLRGKLE